MSARLAAPGPSYLRELELRPVRSTDATTVAPPRYLVGMAEPRTMADDWWVALLWVAGPEGLADFRDVAPTAGPPPDPPLSRLGPSLSGGLSGMIAEEGGRQLIRLRLGVPAADDSRPWEVPLIVLAAFRFEPLRVATMRPNEIAHAVLEAFRRAVDSLSRP